VCRSESYRGRDPQAHASGRRGDPPSRRRASSPAPSSSDSAAAQDAELAQLALDPDAAPTRALTRQPQHQLTAPAAQRGGRPAARHRYVHFRRTSSRRQRRSVCGETTNADHRPRGIRPLAAARTTRSRRRKSGASRSAAADSARVAALRSPPRARQLLSRPQRRGPAGVQASAREKKITPPRIYGHSPKPRSVFPTPTASRPIRGAEGREAHPLSPLPAVGQPRTAHPNGAEAMSAAGPARRRRPGQQPFLNVLLVSKPEATHAFASAYL
jgi:hypothetical protein